MTAPASSTPSGAGHGRAELRPRLLTAAVAIPILLALIIAGGVPFVFAVAALLALGTVEIVRAAGLRPAEPLSLCAALAAAAMAPAALLDPDGRPGVLAALVAASLLAVVVRAEVQDGFARWAAVVAAATYVGILGSALVTLRMLDDGRAWTLLMLFTTFATDTGAFVIGRAFGRRRLAPRVSPSKTVAGAVGGLAAGGLAAIALNTLLGLDRAPVVMLALGAVAAAAAESGDLAESLLKRSLGVKDMGHLFPGHGGVLDRLDSVLFAAPVVYYAARWLV